MPVAAPDASSPEVEAKRKPRRQAADTERALERRRNALVGAAERVFIRQGYHAATMDEIAAAAGMSKRTLYQLVKSKEQLFLLLLERHRPFASVSIDPSREPEAMLFDILDPWARQLLTPGGVSLLRLIIGDYRHGRTLARLLDRSSAQLCKDTVAEYLGGLAAAGRLKPGDPEEASQMLYGMAIGSIHFGMLIGWRGAPSREEVEGRLRRAIDIFLTGARA